MTGSLPALAMLALVVIVGVLCATADGLLVPHVEASDECCGLVHCSVVTIGRARFAPWVVAVTVGLSGVAAARSTLPRPDSPPPELLHPRPA